MRIDYRQSTAGSICGRDRRTDEHLCSGIMRNSFRCIKNLAAANTNCKITAVV